MAYCRKCGAVIDDEAVICPKCGVPQSNAYAKPVQENVPQTDGSVGMVLGFIAPLFGLIAGFYYSSKGDHKAAKNSFIVSGICFVIYLSIIIAINS